MNLGAGITILVLVLLPFNSSTTLSGRVDHFTFCTIYIGGGSNL